MEHAVSIAEKFDSDVKLLSVPMVTVPIFDEEDLETSSFEGREIDQHYESVWDFHRGVLTEAERRVISEHPELKTEKILREGRPSTISEVAESEGVDLIVMGSRGIRGIASWILRSTSRRVMDSSDKPVLVVK